MKILVELTMEEILALKVYHHGKTTLNNFAQRARANRLTFPTGWVSDEDIQNALIERGLDIEVRAQDVLDCARWQTDIEGTWLERIETWIDEERSHWTNPDNSNFALDAPERDMIAPKGPFV